MYGSYALALLEVSIPQTRRKTNASKNRHGSKIEELRSLKMRVAQDRVAVGAVAVVLRFRHLAKWLVNSFTGMFTA